MSDGAPSGRPRHVVVVLPWLRRPAQRFVLPDWLAITIGPLILAWRPLDEAELAHELVHVRQWRQHGLRFIARYLRASAEAARGGDRYVDNAFEVEARAAADAVTRRGSEQATRLSPGRAGPSRRP